MHLAQQVDKTYSGACLQIVQLVIGWVDNCLGDGRAVVGWQQWLRQVLQMVTGGVSGMMLQMTWNEMVAVAGRVTTSRVAEGQASVGAHPVVAGVTATGVSLEQQ